MHFELTMSPLYARPKTSTTNLIVAAEIKIWFDRVFAPLHGEMRDKSNEPNENKMQLFQQRS